MLTDADRRAGAVNEESATRLDALTETHGEVVRRLAQIRDVLGDLLSQDASAGSLAAAVDAALGLPLGQAAEPGVDNGRRAAQVVPQEQQAQVAAGSAGPAGPASGPQGPRAVEAAAPVAAARRWPSSRRPTSRSRPRSRSRRSSRTPLRWPSCGWTRPRSSRTPRRRPRDPAPRRSRWRTTRRRSPRRTPWTTDDGRGRRPHGRRAAVRLGRQVPVTGSLPRR